MLQQLRSVLYPAALKWKQGEARAYATVPPAVRADTLLMFDIPPAGDFDHETGRTPTLTEHIKLFGRRLASHCGSMPVFVDAQLIDRDGADAGPTHVLTQLLERGRLAGARPCPVTGLDRSRPYQQAVAKFVRSHPAFPVCLRISADQLESTTLRKDLEILLDAIGCPTSRIFVVLDFKAMSLEDEDLPQFCDLLAKRINEFPFLHEWLNIAFLMTSLPADPKLKAGQSSHHPRQEWKIFQNLVALEGALLRRPVYSDYALEYPGRYITGKIQPVAQMRYTSEEEYLFFKGTTTKKPNGYDAVREVAERLVATPEYMGADYSAGNAFIEGLVRRLGGPGNASTWRWAWTDHHLTKAWRGIRGVLRLPLEASQVPTPDPQLDFFPADKS